MRARTFLSLVGAAFGLLGGVGGSAFSVWITQQNPPLTYGVVDTAKLIQQQISLMMTVKEEEKESLTEKAYQTVRRTLHTWSQENHIIVLDKKVVLTPLPDVTASLLRALQLENSRRKL